MNSAPGRTSWKPLILIFVLSGLFYLVFLGITFFHFSGGGGAPGARNGSPLKKTAVGLVELDGVIMDSKRILKTLDRFEEAGEVKAIVVRINSPGGAVAPSQEIYEALKQSKKPIIASMSNVAASGGYYVALGARKIFANPGTITGSIGVIMEFANLEKLYDWAKIRRYSIKTGRFKDAGAEYRDMQPEERELFQAMVNDVLDQFKTAVAAARKMPPEAVTGIADGRIFSGSQAKAVGLVDELGTLDDAIREAGKQAGIQGRPRVITDERKKDFWKLLSEVQGDEEADTDASLHWTERLIRAIAGRVPGVSAMPRLTPGIYWLWAGGA